MNYPETIQQLEKKLHWLQFGEDGVLEIYLDNHMLQTFRMCEARFFEEFVEGYKPKGSLGRIWFLDFGVCVHKAVEIYYRDRKKGAFDLMGWISKIARQIWDEKDMEYWANEDLWKGHKYNSYKDLGGFLGFCGLLFQYAQYFSVENERFRVIGTELYFGKNKEVPLLDVCPLSLNAHAKICDCGWPFRLYLAGKIDLLVDDGYSIGPMDHKTSRDFMGKNPTINYEIQEGMTGYVFAAKAILANFNKYTNSEHNIPHEVPVGRQVNKIWMNFLQVKPAKANMADRFKRVPLYKTDEELEMYRQRQISTAARIYQLLENYKEDGSGLQPFYNHMACTNWMHRNCLFQPVHRQNSRQNQLTILNVDFVKDQSGVWNPEQVED